MSDEVMLGCLSTIGSGGGICGGRVGLAGVLIVGALKKVTVFVALGEIGCDATGLGEGGSEDGTLMISMGFCSA